MTVTAGASGARANIEILGDWLGEKADCQLCSHHSENSSKGFSHPCENVRGAVMSHQDDSFISGCRWWQCLGLYLVIVTVPASETSNVYHPLNKVLHMLIFT